MVKDMKRGFITIIHAVFFTKIEHPREPYVEAYIPNLNVTLKGKTKKDIIQKIEDKYGYFSNNR